MINKRKPTTTIVLSKKDREYLKYLQEKMGESQSDVIRSAISYYYYNNVKQDEK